MKKPIVEFELFADFTDLIGDQSIVTVGIGPQQDAILLLVDTQDKDVPFGREEQPGWASFPKTMANHPYPATVIRCENTLRQKTVLPQLESAFPFIQPLGDDILIVSARCYRTDGLAESNAAVYNTNGQRTRRMVFGDGIESVQVASDQQIWVSYFDEGVYGNYGWNDPLGARGLLRFNQEGDITWAYQAPKGFGPIDDCYALNVADDAVWICYYNSFPIIKITRGQMHGWENPVHGANALVVGGNHVLLWGGFGKDSTRCVIQTIDGDRLNNLRKLDLRLPAGDSFDKAVIIGRGSILHAFVGTHWYQFDLDRYCKSLTLH